MSRRMGGIDGEGLADELYRSREVVALIFDDAEQIAGVEMVGCLLQYRPIQPLGLTQPSGLMQGQSVLQAAGERRGLPRGGGAIRHLPQFRACGSRAASATLPRAGGRR